MNIVDPQIIHIFFQKLNEKEIKYVLIKNIMGEIPNHLRYGKDIDILLDIRCKKQYDVCMAEMGFCDIIHPQSIENGWQMLYGTTPPLMKKIPDSLEVDAHFELAVQSVMKRQWCPLDKLINARVWTHKQWNEALNCWCLDEKTLVVYLIARCVFDKEKFSEGYILEIERRISFLDDSEVIAMLKKVFFKFTSSLIEEVKQGNYAEIIGKYFSFDNY